MGDNHLTILAIDDIPDNLKSLRAVVAEVFPGAAVVAAMNGPKGLELAKAEDPSVILLDIVMPGMDGFEVCRRLKADEQTREIPVVFLTAQDDRSSRLRALEVGGEAFLAKPLDPDEVAAQVRAMVKICEAARHRKLENSRLATLVAERTAALERELAEHRRSMEELQRAHAEAAQSQVAMLNLLEDQKRVTAELARNDAELTAIYDYAPTTMLLIDENGTVRRVNQAATTLGLVPLASGDRRPTPGSVLACVRSLDDPRGCGFGPNCATCPVRRALRETLQSGVSLRRLEFPLQAVRHGEVVDIQALASTARVAVDGESLVLLCLEDITELRQAEQRVREHAALLDITHDAIMVVDFDGRLNYWNKGAEQLYGWTASEAIGASLGELLAKESGQADVADAMRSVRAKGHWDGEWVQRTRHGVEVAARCRGVLMVGPTGEPQSILLTASDVTEAKQLEQQFLRAQRLETLGALASGIAHDLNNVFTPIMISVDFLHTLVRERDDREMVRMLADSTRRGSDIVRQLLVFGRGSNAPHGVIRVPLLLEELRRLLRETFPKNISVSIQVPADIWQVHGDSTQLHQVLLNLCVNARDAMRNGGLLAIIAENRQVDETLARANLGARPGPHVMVCVSDTGDGIPPENIAQIFDPFFTTKPIGEGTGLGLSTVLQIIRQHHGFVTVRSQPGAGSEFSVFLPQESKAGLESGGNPQLPASHGKGELVLVVDDEKSILSITGMALETSGYRILVTSDGRAAEALCAANRNELRLLITDMMMPGFDGMETIKAVRRILPQLPVVVISGMHEYQAALAQLPPPRVHLLKKPFTGEMLRAEVRSALDAPPE